MTVPPNASLTTRMSSSGATPRAKRRCGEMDPLSDVRGALKGEGGGVDLLLLAQPAVALGQLSHGAEGAAHHRYGALRVDGRETMPPT